MDAKSFDVITFEGESRSESRDQLAPEAPLHIAVNGESYLTTMRTPDGFDQELARGLLFTEGIITDSSATMSFSQITDPETRFAARIEVTVDTNELAKPVANSRNQLAGSSCGICGTREPADLELYGDPLVIADGARVNPASLTSMMDEMKSRQVLFESTGGTHGASAFTATGNHFATHEDIGRHNAVDKVIGTLLTQAALNDAAVLTVSSRLSYEIVTKAYRAGIPILAAVSAPSAMAVETAAAFGITLVAFCREGRMTVYTHPERIAQSGNVI